MLKKLNGFHLSSDKSREIQSGTLKACVLCLFIISCEEEKRFSLSAFNAHISLHYYDKFSFYVSLELNYHSTIILSLEST